MKNFYGIVALVGVVAAGAAAQGRPPAPELKPLAVEAGEHFLYKAVEDDRGGFYVVWTHWLGANAYAILAQHQDADGKSLWEASRSPIADRLSSSTGWDAFADGKGGLLVAWQEAAHIHAQRLDPAGNRLWPPSDRLVTVSSAPQALPALTADAGGGAYIVWSEKRYPDRLVMMAQHVNALGAALWSADGVRISLRSSDQRRARVVFDGQSGAVVGWKDFRESASQVQAARLDYQGNRLWGNEGVVITAPAGTDKRAPTVAAVGGGTAVFAWEAPVAGVSQVIVQLIDAQGRYGWDPRGIQVSLNNSDQWNPVLHGDGQGGIWVAWEDYRNRSNWQILIQRLNAAGQRLWPVEMPLARVRGDQGRLAMVDDGYGGLLAAWIDNRAGRPGVYLQEISADGQQLAGWMGKTVTEGLTNPALTGIVALGRGAAAVLWVDQPAKDAWELYAERVVNRVPNPAGQK